MSGRIRGVLALTAAAAVVVGVAGCGGGDDGAKKPAAASKAPKMAPADAVNASYKKLTGIRSAKMRLSVSLPAAASGSTGGASTTEGSGVVNWNPVSTDLTLSGSAFGQTEGMPEKIHEVTVGTVMYMDMGADAAKDMDGRRWMKMDLVALGKQAGGAAGADAFASSMQNSNQDLSQQFAQLAGSSDVKRVGSEKVDGVTADHYRGTLTLEQILRAMGKMKDGTAADTGALRKTLVKQGLASEDVDVWIGGDGMPVRTLIAVRTAAGTTTTDTHFSDFSSTPVKVTAPPASQTFDLQEVLKQMTVKGAKS